MLHERILVLVKYVMEVVAGDTLCRELGFGGSERNDSRSGNQGSRRLAIVVGANGFPAGDGEPGVSRGI